MFAYELGERGVEIFRNIIEQLTHQHARWQRLVIPQRLPDVTEIENFARGKKRLQKKFAINVADISISAFRMLRHFLRLEKSVERVAQIALPLGERARFAEFSSARKKPFHKFDKVSEEFRIRALDFIER